MSALWKCSVEMLRPGLWSKLHAGGRAKWGEAAQALSQQYANQGQVNLAAMLSIVLHDPLQALEQYRQVLGPTLLSSTQAAGPAIQ